LKARHEDIRQAFLIDHFPRELAANFQPVPNRFFISACP
jgi:hypothetical protein